MSFLEICLFLANRVKRILSETQYDCRCDQGLLTRMMRHRFILLLVEENSLECHHLASSVCNYIPLGLFCLG